MHTINLSKSKRLILNISVLAVLAILLFVLELNKNRYGMAVSILQKGAILAIVAVSMNLLNGFTGLFSLGQAGFMAIGAYVTAIVSIPIDNIEAVYYTSGIAPWLMTFRRAIDILPDSLRILVGLLLGGLLAGIFAALIGIPVLRLKSDYLAIATLGFSEIVRAIISSPQMDQITNGSYGLKNIPGFGATGNALIPAGTGTLLIPFAITGLCIAFMVLVIRSSYGRAFMAIREDGVAAEAMGINLLRHKGLSFVISSFFTAIAGGLLSMFMRSIEARTFQVSLTYDILLIVVIGGLGSVTGSVISAFLVTAAKEWWLRFFDQPLFIGDFQVPLFRTGFRMVVFSLVLMAVVLFFRRGLMGSTEFSWSGLLSWPSRRRARRPSAKTSVASPAPEPVAPSSEPSSSAPDPAAPATESSVSSADSKTTPKGDGHHD